MPWLNFAIPFPKIYEIDYYLDFESICHNLGDLNDSCGKLYRYIIDNIRSKVAALAHHYYRNIRQQSTNSNVFCKNDIKLLNDLAEDDTIVVTRTDKGRGTVILNKKDYISKLNSLLADQTKFKLITDDTYKTVLSLDEKLNSILRKIKDKLAAGV